MSLGLLSAVPDVMNTGRTKQYCIESGSGQEE